MDDNNAIKEYVDSLDFKGLQACQQFLTHALSKLVSIPPNPNDYVDYIADFIDETDRDLLLAELESLNFKLKTQSEKVQNEFISSSSEPYGWNSSKGEVVINPHALVHFPTVKRIIGKIFSKLGYSMNSALVSCYANGCVNCRLHEDGEDTMDQSQAICVLSLGTVRKVEFVGNDKTHKYKADLTIEPEDCSLYIMKPGCQSLFKHRVRRDKSIHDHRISISFRCFVPSSSGSAPVPPVSPNTLPLHVSTPAKATSVPRAISQDTSVGYSPFPTLCSMASASGQSSKLHQSEKVCLLFGSSITTRVNGQRMSRGSRLTINLSENGANIYDVNRSACDFHADNPLLVQRVDKVIVNIGTNDVKWFNGRAYSVSRKCRAPLCNLIRDLKFMFPLAKIVFVSMLPIKAFYNYTAFTVNSFNRLLINVCKELGCLFFDCFRDFLAPDCRDYNSNLFRDKWHLNDHGLRLFCRALKYVIFDQSFNPFVGVSWHNAFYN